MIGNDAIEFGQSGCRSKKPIHFAECDGSLCGPSVIGTVVEILESVCQFEVCLDVQFTVGGIETGAYVGVYCTSRKTASMFLRSFVNLIVGCMWSSLVIMASSCRSVPSHTTKMPSMNLFQRRGLIGSFLRKRSSSFAMKRLASVGATRGPMATPISFL